jgi:hypothetical protein
MMSEEDIDVEVGYRGLEKDLICPCETLDDFDIWAGGPDGPRKVKRALVEGVFFNNVESMARQWLAIKEAGDVERMSRESLAAAARAALAAESAAKWTMIAAVAAAIGTAVSALTALLSFYAAK